MALRVAGGGSGSSGVQTVTAGTNVTLGGTAQNPVINSLGGSTPPTPTTFTTTISLANASNGLGMGVTAFRAPTTFTVTGAVDDGYNIFTLVSDGVAADVPTFPAGAGNPNNFSFINAVGAENTYLVLSMPNYGNAALAGKVNFYGSGGLTYPMIGFGTIADAARTQIVLTLDSTVQTPLPATSSLSGTASTSGAFTVSALANSGSTLTITRTTGTFVAGETVTVAYTQPGTNNLTTLNGVVPNSTGVKIINNIIPSSAIGVIVDNSATLPNPVDLTNTYGTTAWVLSSTATNGKYCWKSSGPVTAINYVGQAGFTGLFFSYFYTATAADNNFSATINTQNITRTNAGTAGTPYSMESTFAMLSAGTWTLDFWCVNNSGSSGTFTVSLADGSASPQNFTVTAGATERRFTATVTIAAPTTISGKLTSPNASGAGSMLGPLATLH